MKKPEFLKLNGTIGVIAPSFGVFEEPYISRYFKAKEFFLKQGYHIVECPSLFKENFLDDAKPNVRAKEFMDMYLDERIDILFSAAGGELMIELLEYIDFDKIKKAKPKFFMGYSDNTNLTFTLSTICDISSIYGVNFTSFGKDLLYPNDHFLLASSQKKLFNSYPKYDDGEKESFTKDVYYKGECDIRGQFIGGCMESLQTLCGTKYDHVKEFNNKYHNLIWYLEPCQITPLMVRSILWQLRNAHWFDKAICFVFGRSVINDSFTYEEAIYRALGDLNIPIIINADIGHVAPNLPIMNGQNAHLVVKKGKGMIEYD